ncbi:agmatine/peptidylarginine deiminase [Streptosporangium becharense]|uniref:Agmatine/peptidylarginine deiminase n=1 Tax=Streptosporangium becharense TaxID=1816182 RepID=A0A7W9INJ6_9ACTN|nr:agmatine deiminase family protein [Streptosporangium becharense]MBB2910571.1 agmatine/peptidylarginine deiminase [Streptosporangium becharense]MBB5823314.1 agmatine/peptidylarginine deiminase [Streptosporangium becharense]
MPALTGTPADDGFRMPAEWEPHEGCWMLRPERPDNWRAGAKPAQAAFALVAHAVADAGDPVTVGVSAAQFRHARASLSAAVRVVELSFDDAWIRDTGPTFVVDGRGGRRDVDWIFNAWGGLEGGLYFPWPGVVCLTWTDDEQDPQHAISRDALERLERATDARGRPLEVHKVPLPGPLHYSEEEARGTDRRGDGEPWRLGRRMPGSYVNFYVANRGVVVPLLDPLHDEQVLAQLGDLFPGRDVIGVPAREVLLGGGNVHCITQQVPTPLSWSN